MEEYFEEIFNL